MHALANTYENNTKSHKKILIIESKNARLLVCKKGARLLMRRRRLLAARGFWLSDAFEADSIKRRRGNVTSLVLWLLALINFVMEQHDVDRRIRSTNSSLTSSR